MRFLRIRRLKICRRYINAVWYRHEPIAHCLANQSTESSNSLRAATSAVLYVDDMIENNAEKSPECQMSLFPDLPNGGGPPYDLIVELYNTYCDRLVPCKQLTSGRRRALRARWRQKRKWQSLDWWRRYFEYINSVNFLCGENDLGWVANFEFVIKESKFLKIVEGHYENWPNVAKMIASYRDDDVRYFCVVGS